MVVTRGGEALRVALEPGKRSQSDLARELGVKQPSVSEWVRMNARPEAHLRKAIERVLGIPEGDWMTDDERVIAESGPPNADASGAVKAITAAADSSRRIA